MNLQVKIWIKYCTHHCLFISAFVKRKLQLFFFYYDLQHVYGVLLVVHFGHKTHMKRLNVCGKRCGKSFAEVNFVLFNAW